jgi:predicted phage tail protein
VITLVLHGRLGERYAHPVTGRRWALEVGSIGEGLRAIDSQMGGLFEFIWESEADMQGYHVQVNGESIGEDMLGFGFAGDVVEITPLLAGTDTKGIIQLVAGVVLIAAGIVTYGSSTLIGVQLVGLGLAVALGGVARFLAAAPPSTLGTQDKSKSSYIFTGPVNTVQQGECVPVAYGDVICGSAVVSAGIESEDISN